MAVLIYSVSPEYMITDEGREAFIHGVPENGNPYDPRTMSHRYWRRGWIEERTDAHDLIKEAGRRLA